MTPSKVQVQKALRVTIAVAEAIKDLGQVPAGVLYAHLMGHLSLEEFESVLGILIKEGLVKRDGSHMLTYIGPKGD